MIDQQRPCFASPFGAPHRNRNAANGTVVPYGAARQSAVAHSRRAADGPGDCSSRSQSRSSRREVVKSLGVVREADALTFDLWRVWQVDWRVLLVTGF